MNLFNQEQENKDAFKHTLRKAYGVPKVIDETLQQFKKLLEKIK